MPKFEFIVSRGDDILLREVKPLPALDGAWNKIVEVAEKVDEPGARIRVYDENGRVAFMMGIVAAKAVARGFTSSGAKDGSSTLKPRGS